MPRGPLAFSFLWPPQSLESRLSVLPGTHILLIVSQLSTEPQTLLVPWSHWSVLNTGWRKSISFSSSVSSPTWSSRTDLHPEYHAKLRSIHCLTVSCGMINLWSKWLWLYAHSNYMTRTSVLLLWLPTIQCNCDAYMSWEIFKKWTQIQLMCKKIGHCWHNSKDKAVKW